MDLNGKVCIVTGASSGIGEAIALTFAERNASLVLCGRSKTRLDSTAAKCKQIYDERNANTKIPDDDKNKSKNNKCVTVLGDLTSSEVREKICQTAVDAFGGIDVLVANAGILGLPLSLDSATEENYDSVMDTDVKAVFFLVQKALPWLEKSASGGSVVCMSSTASAISGDAIVYHMAKASIDHMCRCLSAALGPRGIRVNSVNPTFVQTRLLRSVMPEVDSDTPVTSDPFTESKHSLHPLGGRCATPQDVAKAVAFLAGDQASFVTGQNLFVDGGITQTCLAFQN